MLKYQFEKVFCRQRFLSGFQATTSIICENENRTLTCTAGNLILVHDAFYGGNQGNK